MKKLFSGMLLLAAVTANAQHVSIKLNDGTDFQFDSKDIKSIIVDHKTHVSQPGDEVKGVVSLNGQTYTKTVGGTVGSPVDLGLPSGTLWADRNIGASAPEGYGAYLTWGEVGAAEEGYKNGLKDTYEWTTYKFCPDGKSQNIIKYTRPDRMTSSAWYKDGIYVGDATSELAPEDDAAYINWGRDWKMPTPEQLAELVNKKYTEWSIEKINNVVCYKIKSVKNNNFIILPIAGYRYSKALNSKDSSSGYWSCSLGNGYTYTAYELYSASANISNGSIGNIGSANSDIFYRYCGQSVRPVYVKKVVASQE